MPISLSQLERDARAATPGPWNVDEEGVWTRIDGRYRVILSANITDDRRTLDARHIANMSPEVAVKLVDAIRLGKIAIKGANKANWDAFVAALEGFEL